MLTRIEALLLTTWMTWKEPWRTRVSIPIMTDTKRPQVTPTMRCTSGKPNIWWNVGLTIPPWYICIGLFPWTPNRRWVRCCQQVCRCFNTGVLLYSTQWPVWPDAISWWAIGNMPPLLPTLLWLQINISSKLFMPKLKLCTTHANLSKPWSFFIREK